MKNNHPRMVRESKTITAMAKLYCEGKHGTKGELCAECAELESYAQLRLEHCPFQETKSTCAKCPVHCYKPAMRARVREMMRWAGPRMLLRHPVLAIMHLMDGRRPAPALKSRTNS